MVPASFLLDERGRLLEVFFGWTPETERRIHTLLEREGRPPGETQSVGGSK
jgi:hypothetical protein